MRVSKKALSLVLAITVVLSMVPGSLVYASTNRSTYPNSKNYSDSQAVSLKSNADRSEKDSNIPVAVTGIELNKTALTLENGTSDTLTAAIHPDNATDQEVAWSTSNSTVCKVDQTGKVSAIGNGTATISVITNDGGLIAKCKVDVITTLTGLTLNKTKVNLAKGASDSLVATQHPDGAPQQKVLWVSSDENVCTVDSLGVITAVNPGIAVISATTKDSGLTATCIVTVGIPVTGITLSKTKLTLNKGKSQTLTANITPANATNQKVYWKSSNSNICSVDHNGKVSALTNGTAVITVFTDDGTFTASCTVTVVTPVTGITLNKTVTTISKGGQETLIATITPSDATNKNVIWQSTDESVCTVDSCGTVSALAEGTAVIFAATVDGGHTAVCVVNVVTSVTGVSLNKTELNLNQGNSETLTATVFPDDATKQDVTWMTSNASVCTVDDGKVTAVGNGSAMITIVTDDGAFSASCTVNVTTPASGVSLNKTRVTLIKGAKDVLTATVTPENASNKDVSWGSSDDTVCAVDSSGNICAMNAGTTEITVKTKDGGYTAECTVTVIVPVTGITLNKSDVTLKKGNSEILTTTIIPSDATDQKVFWSTSDNSVCTVDQNGKVTAKGNGSALVTVTLLNGGYTASCNVTVITSVTGVSLDKTAATLTKGSKGTLTATITPADASDKGVKWSSSDSSVCTVDDGTITALSVGSAVITATTEDGGYTATCAVTVVIPVTSVILNKSETYITKGKNETLTATISPSDVTDNAISWKSSDEKIAVVDQTGKITAVSVGTATITVTTHDGGLTAQCKVTVTPDYFTVTVNAVNGSVKGTGKYLPDSSVTLTETPNTGYHFINWTDEAGNVLSTDNTYTFTKLSADVVITANFAVNVYSVTAASTTGGTVSGVGNYNYGSTATLTAIPDAHYHFSGWSDGVSSATRTITVTQNVNVTATFALDSYTVTATSGANGSTSGSGTYIYGTTVTLKAVPDAHYHFAGWSDGVSSATRTITVAQDINVTANFAIDTFTVTATYGANGSINGCGTYAYGSNATITAVPAQYYHFVSWSDGVTTAARVFTVTQNISVAASFAADPVTWTYNSTGTASLQDWWNMNSNSMDVHCCTGANAREAFKICTTFSFSHPITLESGIPIYMSLQSRTSPYGNTFDIAVFGTDTSGNNITLVSQMGSNPTTYYTQNSSVKLSSISIYMQPEIAGEEVTYNGLQVLVKSTENGQFYLGSSGTTAQ